MALVSSADSFQPCLDFKLGHNYVVFLGGKIPAFINLLAALSEDLAQYKARWPTPAILRVTHTVVCTARLYSSKHTVVLIWSSCGVKNHATSSLFLLFFNIKFIIFFQKRIYQKVSEMLRLHSYIL